MTGEEILGKLLEALEGYPCKVCSSTGNSNYGDETRKFRECSNCDGAGKVPPYVGQQLASRLRELCQE